MTEFTIQYPVDNWEYKYGDHGILKSLALKRFLKEIAARKLELNGTLEVSGLIDQEPTTTGPKGPRAIIKVFGDVTPREN